MNSTGNFSSVSWCRVALWTRQFAKCQILHWNERSKLHPKKIGSNNKVTIRHLVILYPIIPNLGGIRERLGKHGHGKDFFCLSDAHWRPHARRCFRKRHCHYSGTINSHAGGWSLGSSYAVKSIFKERASLDRLHYFSWLSSKSFLHLLLKLKFFKNNFLLWKNWSRRPISNFSHTAEDINSLHRDHPLALSGLTRPAWELILIFRGCTRVGVSTIPEWGTWKNFFNLLRFQNLYKDVW